MLPVVAGITGMYHRTQLFLLSFSGTFFQAGLEL
jgi:hypothetical protein